VFCGGCLEFGPALLRSSLYCISVGLCFVVFCDVGLVDQLCFGGSGPIQCFSGGWVSDSVGFIWIL